VVGPEGVRSITLLAFCPRRESTLEVSVCQRCPRLSQIDLHGDCPAVACDPGVAQTPEHDLAGSLARPVVLCARPETPLVALDEDEQQPRIVPVVDESARYIGVVVAGRSSAPPSLSEVVFARLAAPRTAGDALEHAPTVHERDDVVTAAATMTSSRARSVAVVNDAGAVVGVLDDIALLGSIARAHRASEVLKRCSCGTVYTREQWSELTLLGAMPDRDGEPVELRTCTACGSTLAMSAALASSDVA
jgi:CBS domain-containing protein